jgi:RND family efflux transporter MFP subunit
VFLAATLPAACSKGDAADQAAAPQPATGAPAAAGAGGRGGRGGPAITPVEVELAGRTEVVRTSLVTGVLEPIRTVRVTSLIGGTVQSITAEEGTRVRAGQVLAELDTRELSAQLRSAEANLALAKSVADRSTALHAQRVVTDAEFERDRAALAAAEASVEQLRTRVSFARVTAPISGVITAQTVEAGDVINGQAVLYTIADVSTLVALFGVSELEVLALNPGARVGVTVDALNGATVEGRVRRVFPAADPTSRLVPVEVAITGAAARELRPGFTVRARLALEDPRAAITVPSRALAGPSGSRYLFVIEAGKAVRRVVQAGDDRDGRSEVFSGVVEGDSVIVAGNSLLRDGGAVRVVPPIVADTARRGAQ